MLHVISQRDCVLLTSHFGFTCTVLGVGMLFVAHVCPYVYVVAHIIGTPGCPAKFILQGLVCDFGVSTKTISIAVLKIS